MKPILIRPFTPLKNFASGVRFESAPENQAPPMRITPSTKVFEVGGHKRILSKVKR